MSNRAVQNVIAAIGFLSCLSHGHAQQSAPGALVGKAPVAATAPTSVPALVPYSGAALDGKGNPLAGEASATFLIYKDQQGGEPLFAESQMIAFDDAGRYKIQLGASNPNGLPSDLFATGEARWLEVQIAGQPAQPRILLASVPYALKAADAATLGGLPASAFALAGANGYAANAAAPAGASPNTATAVTTTGGTSGSLPLFTGASTIANANVSQSSTGKIGINTTTPSATLDINGYTDLRGTATLTANGSASPTAGVPSYPLNLTAQVYNSSTKAKVSPSFDWEAVPIGNNSASPSAALDLLYSNGTTTAPTGFSFNANGTINFASGQTFPGGGGGSITGVTAGTGLTGGGTSGNVTLNVNTGTIASLAGNNTFTGSDTFNASLYENTDVNIDNKNANSGNISPGLRLGSASGEGMASKRTSGGNQFGVDIYTGYSPRLSINASGQVAIGTGATFGGSQLQVQSADLDAIYGETSYNAYEGAAVYGYADGAANGVIASSAGGNGGEFFGGVSSGGLGLYGVYGLGGSSTGNQQNGGYGVFGYGGDADGLASIGGNGGNFQGGYSSEYEGGFGASFTGGDSAVSGLGGYGIFVTGGQGSNNSGPDEGFSAVFRQDISVNGATVNSVQKIKIDDPADPANKYLVHTAVASSEQMNIYSGNVTTDELGVATVTLPTWFQELNTDFRYQLTVVGGRFAQAIVSKEIAGNQFTISTNATGVKVSWQVTAVRQDAYAKAHPLVVEQVKGPRERGFYQHPELYGQPEEKQTEWGLHPQAMAQLKAARIPRPAPVKSSQGAARTTAKSDPMAH